MTARLLLRDERGAAIMEFGLMIVPLCLVLLGLLDIGLQMYLRSTMQGAVNDVSRMAVVEDPQFSGTGTTEERISAAVRRRLGGLAGHADWEVEINSFESFSQVNVPEKLVADANDNGEVDPGDCWTDLEVNGEHDADPQRAGLGGADDIALYTATLTMPRVVPMAGLAGLDPNYVIQVKAAVRNQPYSNQAASPTACEPMP